MNRGAPPEREPSSRAHSAFTPTKRNLQLALVAVVVTTLLVSTFVFVVAAASGHDTGVKLNAVYGHSGTEKSAENVVTADEVTPEQYETLLNARDSPQELSGELEAVVANASYVEHSGNYYEIEMVPVPNPTNPITVLVNSGPSAWIVVALAYAVLTPVLYSFLWDAAQSTSADS